MIFLQAFLIENTTTYFKNVQRHYRFYNILFFQKNPVIYVIPRSINYESQLNHKVGRYLNKLLSLASMINAFNTSILNIISHVIQDLSPILYER